VAEKRQYSVALRKTPTFQSWATMKGNCKHPSSFNKNSQFSYLASGIKVCERWRGRYSFEEFLADMGEKPANTILRRKDTAKDFTPENCEWAPRGGRPNRSRFTPEEAARSMLYSNFRSKAKERKLEWAIPKDEFISLCIRNCYYCDVAPKHIKTGYKTRFVYNGLDRVDNTKGYTVSNVVPCCRMCNVAKNYYPQEEFLQWVGKVYLHNFKRTTDCFIANSTAPATTTAASV
jgi:hypothetical protein